MAAIGIIMNKILRIFYSMLKHNKEYDPRIDQANREKKNIKTKPQKTLERKKDRRFQNYDSDAPISHRQAKKREQRGIVGANLSESDKKEKNEITAMEVDRRQNAARISRTKPTSKDTSGQRQKFYP